MRGLVWETAEELDLKIAQRVRDIRKRRSISQKRLSGMSGVSYDNRSDITCESYEACYGIRYSRGSAQYIYTDSLPGYSGGY